MASNFNFRSALSGFNRDDVVHYIEYMNSKFNTQINQMTGEAQELRDKLSALAEIPDLSEELARLKAQLVEAAVRQTQLEEENAALAAERDAALAQIEQIKAEQAENSARELAAMELEAYRRAEQTERLAKARAEQIYQQATGTLAQATTQVDNAALQFRQIAEAVSGQMAQLQMAVDSSKNALLDAATTMYAIRPEHNAD